MSAESPAIGLQQPGTTLSESEVDDLWRRYRQTRRDDLRNALLEHYLPVVRYQAERLSARLPGEVDPDDVYAAGILGLHGAVESFEPGRGVKFQTYCAARIRGAILDALRQNDWVPRSVRRKNRSLERARQALEADLGRPPSAAEMADFLGLPDDAYHDLRRRAEPVQVASLDRRVPGTETDHEMTWADLMHGPADEGPEDRVLRKDLKRLVTEALSRKERLVLVLYYWEEMTMREIAATLALSETRICQIHADVLDRLRSNLARRKDDFHGV